LKKSVFEPDEQQILRLLVEGASNTVIASQLYLSNTTLKRKLRRIFVKMEVDTRAQAAAEAVRRGLV
jgi:LuxR family maltose regulon positive regulatory protein